MLMKLNLNRNSKKPHVEIEKKKKNSLKVLKVLLTTNSPVHHCDYIM